MSDNTNHNTTISKKPDQSYWSYVKRQFRKNRQAMFSLYCVIFLAAIAVFADVLSNDKPLVAKYEGSWYFPVFREYAVITGVAQWPEPFRNVSWYDLEYESVVWPPIPYLPGTLDMNNTRFVSPFAEQNVKSWRWRHWLGTDGIGRDVAAGMIHGTRIAFMVGIVSMTIAFIVGVVVGAAAGFFGDDQIRASRGRIFLNLVFFVIAFFYGFYTRSYNLGDAFAEGVIPLFGQIFIGFLIFGGIMFLGNLLAIPFKFIPWLGQRVNVPVDIIVTRLIEVIVSVPVLILILAVVAIAKPSIFNVMAVIGLVRWTGIARFIRAELLRIRNLEYIEAAHALGFSKMRAMFRHAIPNALSPVFVAVAFGIASAILIESFLSFLGFGVPPETITWGKLLALSRRAATAWWLAVFPGFAIFITVTLFNLLGEGLTDALDPRLKQ